MPKRMINHTLVGLMRDDKPFNPTPGTVVELSTEELDAITKANPSAVSLPPDENASKTPTIRPMQNPSDRLASLYSPMNRWRQ